MFCSLPPEQIQHILRYVGKHHYLPIALSGDESLAHEYRQLYGTNTGIRTVFTTISMTDWVCLEAKRFPSWKRWNGDPMLESLEESLAFALAASSGNLELLQYLQNSIPPGCSKHCRRTSKACENAVKEGHLEVLQAVGTKVRMPLGCMDMLQCCQEWPLGCAELGTK